MEALLEFQPNRSRLKCWHHSRLGAAPLRPGAAEFLENLYRPSLMEDFLLEMAGFRRAALYRLNLPVGYPLEVEAFPRGVLYRPNPLAGSPQGVEVFLGAVLYRPNPMEGLHLEVELLRRGRCRRSPLRVAIPRPRIQRAEEEPRRRPSLVDFRASSSQAVSLRGTRSGI